MVRSKLLAAIDRYRSADETLRDYNDNVHMAALTAYREAVAGVPHHRTTASFVNMNGERYSLSTSGPGTVETARRVLQDVKDGHIFTRPIADTDTEYLATIREVVIAADRREIEVERLRAEHRVEESADHSDALGTLSSNALDAALRIPAHDLAELLVKAELIEETVNWEQTGAELLADIRRLAEEAR